MCLAQAGTVQSLVLIVAVSIYLSIHINTHTHIYTHKYKHTISMLQLLPIQCISFSSVRRHCCLSQRQIAVFNANAAEQTQLQLPVTCPYKQDLLTFHLSWVT